MEEVDSEFGLHQEFVPEEHRETRVNTSKDGKKMHFKGADGLFCHILMVNVWGNELVGGVPVFFDDAVELLACFVVKDAAVNGEALFLEAGTAVVVGSNVVLVVIAFEQFHQDDIGHTVVSKHDVLVATVCFSLQKSAMVAVKRSYAIIWGYMCD